MSIAWKAICEWDISERSLGRFPCSRHATKTYKGNRRESMHACNGNAHLLSHINHARFVVIDLLLIRLR